MNEIKVSFGELSNLATTIDGQVQQIDGELSDLKSQIDKLQQTWNGAANEGFVATKNSWDNAAQDLNGVLGRIASAVHAATDAYQQTESKNTSAWSG